MQKTFGGHPLRSVILGAILCTWVEDGVEGGVEVGWGGAGGRGGVGGGGRGEGDGAGEKRALSYQLHPTPHPSQVSPQFNN